MDNALRGLVIEVAKEAIKEYENQKREADKRRHDNRLRNIKLLLRHYRSLVKHCEDIKHDIAILDEKLELDELDTDEFAIEAIKRSKKRTLVLVRFVAKMIAVYGQMCEEEGAEAVRSFEVIKDLYISEPRKSIKEIADVRFLHEKTIRRDRDRAVEALSVLMFGIDAIKMK